MTQPTRPTPHRMIVAAALRKYGVIISMPRPARHHNLFYAMSKLGCEVPDAEQGFLTANGQFVNRRIAMQFATENGQVREGQQHKPELFSEDLW